MRAGQGLGGTRALAVPMPQTSGPHPSGMASSSMGVSSLSWNSLKGSQGWEDKVQKSGAHPWLRYPYLKQDFSGVSRGPDKNWAACGWIANRGPWGGCLS